MEYFDCPDLGGRVELSPEREHHILLHHPEVLPAFRGHLQKTLLAPDQVLISPRMNEGRLFYRWFDEIMGGKYVVVVVVLDQDLIDRNWIVTTYLSTRIPKGAVEWRKN